MHNDKNIKPSYQLDNKTANISGVIDDLMDDNAYAYYTIVASIDSEGDIHYKMHYSNLLEAKSLCEIGCVLLDDILIG